MNPMPDETLRPNRHRQIPLTVTWCDGSQQTVGYANLEHDNKTIKNVVIQGEAALEILQSGTDGFALGYPPEFHAHFQKAPRKVRGWPWKRS